MSSYGFTEGGIGYIGSYPGGFVGKNKIYVWTWEQSVYERDVEKLNVYFPKQGESIVFGKCYSLDSEAKGFNKARMTPLGVCFPYFLRESDWFRLSLEERDTVMNDVRNGERPAAVDRMRMRQEM